MRCHRHCNHQRRHCHDHRIATIVIIIARWCQKPCPLLSPPPPKPPRSHHRSRNYTNFANIQRERSNNLLYASQGAKNLLYAFQGSKNLLTAFSGKDPIQNFEMVGQNPSHCNGQRPKSNIHMALDDRQGIRSRPRSIGEMP